MCTNSAKSISDNQAIPKHVAIIMDGNGRWATRRFLPRTSGHEKGIDSILQIVHSCKNLGVKYLTLFAFSSENWRRPEKEISILMNLFMKTLESEIGELARKGIRLNIIGDISGFDYKLQESILNAQNKTITNHQMYLTIAANYGGRWDILQAMQSLLLTEPLLAKNPKLINEKNLSRYLAMSWAPEPDLFIRTGGEKRISNFLIWQLAYTELYFTNIFWPDFNAKELEMIFEWYRNRERRFGRTSEQLVKNSII
ncbi:MAG: di-trans,poly-cis-decaprenylcistransferase [Bordetella sp.]|nr:MAG: di-trans,poly-cis-decaprenylcistransferase [Bordetella sp.]